MEIAFTVGCSTVGTQSNMSTTENTEIKLSVILHFLKAGN